MQQDECSARVIVLGASSLVGSWLIDELLGAGFDILAISRLHGPATDTSRVRWLIWDVSADPIPEELSAQYCVSLLPLWLLPALIECVAKAGVRRVIAFSSTSAESKARSPVEAEQQLAAKLRAAETDFAAECLRCGVAYTIFRPTMIYGAGRDKNLSQIAAFIKRFGFFVVFGGGSGLRQPVHAADAARACRLALGNPSTYAKTYYISGGEVVPYREMVSRVFLSLNRRPAIFDVPLVMLKAALVLAKLIPGYRDVNAGMLLRMTEDLNFDHTEARADFGYDPRPLLLDDAPLIVSEGSMTFGADSRSASRNGSP